MKKGHELFFWNPNHEWTQKIGLKTRSKVPSKEKKQRLKIPYEIKYYQGGF